NVNAGSPFTLTALALGSEPMSYQWRLQETNLPGRMSRLLTVSNASPANAGAYTVFASNFFGVATSATARVNVLVTPSFVVTLTNIAVDTGADVLLSVVAQSSAPLNFAWQFNGASLPATSSNLFLPGVQPAQ